MSRPPVHRYTGIPNSGARGRKCAPTTTAIAPGIQARAPARFATTITATTAAAWIRLIPWKRRAARSYAACSPTPFSRRRASVNSSTPTAGPPTRATGSASPRRAVAPDSHHTVPKTVMTRAAPRVPSWRGPSWRGPS